MKIVLVHNQYRQPGGEDVVFEQERQLLERLGHHVLVYQRSNLEIEQHSLGQRIILAKNIVSAADTRQELTRLLTRERPQLVHIHNTFVMVSPSVYSTCQEANIPVVQTLHNYRLLCPAASLFRHGHICEECVEHSLWRSVRYGCYRGSRSATGAVALMLAVHRKRHTFESKVNGYIALTEFARAKLIAGGLPAERIFVKPNFVYPDPGLRRGAAEYAVFAGRLSSEKGLTTLLAAWHCLGNRVPLLILGDGPKRQRLESQAAELGLSSVSFLGHLSRQETWTTIGKARCLIVPSECYETFNLTIAEAFACGTPVICSRLGALREIVEDGRTGLHFTAGDPADLAAKVEWAWSHPAQMNAMEQEARREYEAKYTAERNYQTLAGIYGQTLRAVGLFRAKAPRAEGKWRVHVRSAGDLLGKAWANVLTTLPDPRRIQTGTDRSLDSLRIGSIKPRLLVVDLWGVGDLAVAAPFLRVASHKYEVTLVARPPAEELRTRFWPEVHILPFAAPWTVFEGKYRLHRWPWKVIWQLLRTTRRQNFDIAVSARWDPRDHLLMVLAGAKRRYGFPRLGSKVLLTHRMHSEGRLAHRYLHWQLLARALGFDLPTQTVRANPSANRQIVIHTGAARQVRVWPLERYAHLVRRFRQQGYVVRVLCDANQLQFWREEGEAVTAPRSLTELCALLESATIFIGNDSGPGHLAAVSGIPTFTIFGPQIPGLFAPIHPAAAWIEGAPCRYKPCFDRCRFPAPYCLLDIDEETVWKKVELFATKQMTIQKKL